MMKFPIHPRPCHAERSEASPGGLRFRCFAALSMTGPRVIGKNYSSLLSDVRLYRHLIAMQIRSQLQYKTSALIDITTYFFVTGLEFLTMLLYFVPFPTMLGWHVGEIALLTAVTSFSFGLAELFGSGLDIFSDTIRQGDFDRVLLRPVLALILVASSEFRLRRLGRLTQGVLGFVLALVLLGGLHWTLLKLLALLLGIVSGSLIFLSILLLGATMCFWTVQTSELTNILYYGGREMLSYPISIYHPTIQRILLFVVPLAFGTFLPTCYLLDRPLPLGLPSWLAFLSPPVALAFTAIAVWAWGFGIRHYESTGS
jgi:ABC-2 type transport system permease protein